MDILINGLILIACSGLLILVLPPLLHPDVFGRVLVIRLKSHVVDVNGDHTCFERHEKSSTVEEVPCNPFLNFWHLLRFDKNRDNFYCTHEITYDSEETKRIWENLIKSA